MKTCKTDLKASRAEKWGKCEIVAVDKQFLWSGPSVGVPLDQPLPQPDRPFEKAIFFHAQGGPPKGIVLAIHGSGNAYGSSTPGDIFEGWFEYLQSIGLTVVYTSAFNDNQPVQEYAGWNTPATYPKQTAMQRIRLGQTKRTIGSIKEKYPGLPVYLWSHSAGGNLVQAIDRDISGAIIVGTICGIGHPDLNLVSPDVPLLYVYGENGNRGKIPGKGGVKAALL